MPHGRIYYVPASSYVLLTRIERRRSAPDHLTVHESPACDVHDHSRHLGARTDEPNLNSASIASAATSIITVNEYDLSPQ